VKLTSKTAAGWLLIGLTGVFLAFADEDAPPEHKQWMKDMGAANGALKKGIDVPANAAKLAHVAEEVEKWWAKRTSTVAVQSSKDIAAAAKKIAAAGDDEQARRAAAKEVAAGCRTCHEQHRVKISETEYKIK
jgi:cytochrome c556